MPSRPLPVWSLRPTLVVGSALLVVLTGCGGSPATSEATARDAPSSASSRGPAPATSPSPSSSPDATAEPDEQRAGLRARVPDAGSEPSTTRRLPTPPPLARERSVAGRDAFTEHVIDLWAHALATNDTTPLLALAPARRCGGCADLTRELERRRDEGWFVALDHVAVRSIEGPERIRPGRPLTTVATIDIPATFALNDDHSYRTSNPSHEGAVFEVDLVWRRGEFRLLGYALSE